MYSYACTERRPDGRFIVTDSYLREPTAFGDGTTPVRRDSPGSVTLSEEWAQRRNEAEKGRIGRSLMSVTAELVQDTFRVHEPCQVEIIVRSTRDLAPGDTVEFQFTHSWSLLTGPSFPRPFQSTDAAGGHYVNVSAPCEGARFDIAIHPRTLHFPEGMHRHGRHIIASLAGERVPAGTPVRLLYANTYAPYVAETDSVWLRVKGEAPERAPELTVTPGPAEALRVIAPSSVSPGIPFNVLIVSLDRFENASCTEFLDETLSLADGTVASSHLNFVGRLRVPATIAAEGVFRFRFRDVVSNAVRVTRDRRGPYWGDIHIHTKLSADAQGTAPYAYARDVSGLDFAGTADHCQSLGEEGYEQTLTWAREADAPGRFVTILADERNPRELTGHHNLYFRDEESFISHRHLPGGAKWRDMCSAGLDPARIMVVPHHTGITFGPLPKNGLGGAVDMDAWDDPTGLRPVMEVYSHHGQSEVYSPHHILAYEFNRTRNPERRGNTSVPGPHYAQDYWMKGLRLGAIGSSDEHSGQGGRRHGGIAGVWADKLTRGSIFDAMRARRCYATTGEHILLEFSVDGIEMGGCEKREQGRRLPIRCRVWGTDTLVRVEILRFRFGQDRAFEPILAEPPRPEGLDASYEIEDECAGPSVYYARVVQEPLSWPGMAWSSPVWIETPGTDE